jgi:competence protein CoiA
MLKSQVATAIAAAGWEVATEVRGQCPEGQLWIADVMATRGDNRFAVEIQWSKQSDKVTFDRHYRYKASGVRCLWLFRQRDLNNKTVPAITVAQEKDGQFVVPIDYWRLEDVETDNGVEAIMLNKPLLLPIQAFMTRVFSGRHLWFGIFRQGHQVEMILYGGSQECMSCSRETTLIYRMSLRDRRTNVTLELQPFELDLFGSLIGQVRHQTPQRLKIGPIKKSSHKFAGCVLLNRCFYCSAAQSFMNTGFNEKRIPMRLHSQSVIVTPSIEHAAQHRHVSKWRIDIEPDI